MDRTKPNNSLKKLTEINFEEGSQLLRLAEDARVSLEILNYELSKISNKEVFLDTLYLQEARQSSIIENIITTNDEVFRTAAKAMDSENGRSVLRYRDAIYRGKELLDEKLMINADDVVELHTLLKTEKNDIRSNSPRLESSFTRIRNDKTNEIIYTPPHGEVLITELLNDTLEFVYNDNQYLTHPLIKIALAHCQFEKIHPFYDGNGRIGRVLNILYLVQKKYLSVPILYGSNYINKHKADYYRFLQDCDDGDYQPFVEFMLVSFMESAKKTLRLVTAINEKIKSYTTKNKLVDDFHFMGQIKILQLVVGEIFKKVYFTPQDLMSFKYFDEETGKFVNFGIDRDTVTHYTKRLKDAGLIEVEILKGKRGNPKLYHNIELIRIIDEENKND